MATGVSWGRLIMVVNGLKRPVTRLMAAAPKMHMPAALVANEDKGPEKITLAKDISTMTRMTPMIKP
jgi:hypothetical protein